MTQDDTSGIGVLAIVGPTAAGKTALAEELAVRLDGEIISADSMQIYRGMDIGTAKPPLAERRVPYHCVDIADPGEPFSAALFQREGRRAIHDVAARSRTPIVAGGTGLYVRALLDRMEFPPGEQADNPSRALYERFAEENGAPALHALLAQRDPESAAVIHVNNTRRVVRALEMSDSGVSYAQQREGFARKESLYDTRFVGLTMQRDALYANIDSRVDSMIAQGLVGEVEALLAAGLRDALTAAQAIGYKELVPVIEEDADLETAIAQVKQASRRYAKRQLTWFRGDARIHWIDVSDLSFADTVEAAVDALDLSTR
jgi:tRNA dimethylallyltransferase